MTIAKYFLGFSLVFAPLSAAQRPGDAAPEFTLANGSGAVVRLSDYRGKPVLLNFWATWCLPCGEELALFQEVADETPELTVLLVNMGERWEQAAAYMEANGLTLQTAGDATGSGRAQTEGAEGTLEVARRYRVLGLPTSFFIGADGVVESVSVGPLTAQSVPEYLLEVGVRWEP